MKSTKTELSFEEKVQALRNQDPSVTLIELSTGQGIGDKKAKIMASAITNNTTIKKFRLYRCDGVKEEGWTALASAFENHRSIKEISLQQTELGNEEGCGALSRAFANNTSLNRVQLVQTWAGIDNFKLLCEGLARNRSITSLNILSSTVYGNTYPTYHEALEQSKAVSIILRNSKNLTRLRTNFAVGRGVEEISESLKVNNTIEEIELIQEGYREGSSYPGNEEDGDIGAKALADALEINRSIKSLNLDMPLGNKGTDDLSKVLRKNNVIRKIKIFSGNITNEGIEKILGALQDPNCRVCEFEFRKNNISQELIEKVEKQLIINKDKPLSRTLTYRSDLKETERRAWQELQAEMQQQLEQQQETVIRFGDALDSANAKISELERRNAELEKNQEKLRRNLKQQKQSAGFTKKEEEEFFRGPQNLSQSLEVLNHMLGNDPHAEIIADDIELDNALQQFQTALQMSENISPENLALAELYSNISDIYKFKGEFNKAVFGYSTAIRIREVKLPNSLLLAKSYNDLGQVHEAMSNFDEALECYEKALRIREEKAAGKMTLGLAESLEKIALLYSNQHLNDEAIKWQVKVVEIKKTETPQTLELAESHHVLGKLYQINNELELALQQYKSALSIRQTNAESPQLAESYRAIGDVLHAQNFREDALVNYNNSLEISENLNLRDLATSETLLKVGEIYSSYGDSDAALKEFQKSYAINLDPDDIIRARCCLRIGEILRQRSDIKAAQEKFEEALQIISRKPPQSLLEADIAFNIGEIHRLKLELGEEFDPVATFKFHQRAFLIRRMKEPQGLAIADSFLILGKIYARRGEEGTALNYFQKSAEIRRKNHETESPILSDILFDIGALHALRNEHVEALKAFNESLKIKNEITPNSLEVGLCYENIGRVLLKQNQPNAALENFQKALKIRKDLRLGNSVENADLYVSISNAHQLNNNHDKAIGNLQLAFEIKKKLGSAEAPELALQIANKAFDLRRYDISAEYIRQAGESDQVNFLKSKIYQQQGRFVDAFNSFDAIKQKDAAVVEFGNQLVRQVCENNFPNLATNEGGKLFAKIKPILNSFSDKTKILQNALKNDVDQERKTRNIVSLFRDKQFGNNLNLDQTYSILREVNVDKNHVGKICQKIYSSNELDQTNLFRKFVRDGVLTKSDTSLIKDYAASLLEDDMAKYIMIHTGKDNFRLAKSDRAEVYGIRLSKKYPHLSKMLDIPIEGSFTNVAAQNVLTDFDQAILNLKVKDLLAHLHFEDKININESAQIISSCLTAEVATNLQNSFSPSDSLPYINESESTALQVFTGNLAKKDFQEIDLLTQYLKTKTQNIPLLDAIAINNYTLGRAEQIRSPERENELNELFRDLLQENPNQENSVISFFNKAFDMEEGVINNNNRSKLKNFFQANKAAVAHIFRQDGGLDRFRGMIAVLGDGCVANISTQFRIALYQSLIDDPCDQILYSVVSEKISTPILNFDGADRLGASTTRDNILDHAAINNSFISPAGLAKVLEKEFFKDGVKLRDAREFIKQAHQKNNHIHRNFAFLENVSDHQAAKLAAKSVLEYTMPILLRSAKFSEFVQDCAEIEEVAKKSNTLTVSNSFSPRNASALMLQSLDNLHQNQR